MNRRAESVTMAGLQLQPGPADVTLRFQINLRGIIDLLSNHLYSRPEAFSRLCCTFMSHALSKPLIPH
jgi:hypothetical protein